MTRLRTATAALPALALALAGAAAPAQQTPTNREAINAEFARRTQELNREHVEALAKVAAGETGEAASATYRLLFNLAIARNVLAAAEPAAERAMETKGLDADVEMLAHFINAVAEADRGAFEESLQHLEAYIQGNPEQIEAARAQIDPNVVLGLGEAYFQRLAQAGRYDIARKLCEDILANAKNPGIRDHFTKRLARVGMLGQPAPPIAGTDVDGKPVSLADLKGQVVLVDFWATWCPPCSIQMLKLNVLREKFKDRGFEVLGVNVDGLREGTPEGDATMNLVRRYLVDHQAAFPNVVLGDAEKGVPEAYGVDEIPANFLIGKDGTIVQFELGDGNAVKAIEAALER
jgi:peroxiredoxin